MNILKNITNTNTNLYEYDKYDIIDFLEPEYIKDWLSVIPDDVWIANKKNIEYNVYKLKDKSIISYIIKKINLNISKYVIKYFDKINLELLKYCVEYDFITLKIIIKKNFDKIIDTCIIMHNYEFNKYFYETIYFELKPEHIIKLTPNLTNLFGFLPIEKIHKDNMFYNSIKNLSYNYYTSINDYKIIKYYNEIFINIFTNIKLKKNLYETFVNVFTKSKIDNFDDMINLKNILGFTDLEFKKNLFFGFSKEKYIFPNVCMFGDINFIFQIINYSFGNELNMILNNEYVSIIMVCISLSNKIEYVLLIYNYLVYEKKFKFTKELYSKIIQKIIIFGDKKHYEYKNIIFEFINLGGIIQGYSIYTNYMEKIAIKNCNLN